MKRTLLLTIASLALGLTATAQSIVDTLQASGRVSISQPAKLALRLAEAPAAEAADTVATDAAAEKKQAGGYRILVFSGNNARASKAEAERRAAAISEQAPEWATYIIYDAPYWRLRVGDFRTYDEGTAALQSAKTLFPRYAREMRLVRDRIKVDEEY